MGKFNFMEFIEEYINKLRKIKSDDEVKKMYEWFFDLYKQGIINDVVEQINNNLNLQKEYRLVPGVPVFTVGSRKKLLALVINPRYKQETSDAQNRHCGKSKEDYVDFYFNFFKRFPDIVGGMPQLWERLAKYVCLLKDYEKFNELVHYSERWNIIHKNKLLGGWELFPFQSSKDWISSKIEKFPWLEDCYTESLNAAIRMNPEILLVLSSRGYEIVVNKIKGECPWKIKIITDGKQETKVAFHRNPGNKTELIAVKRLFGFSEYKFINLVNKLRTNS